MSQNKSDFSQWPIVHVTLCGKIDKAQIDMVLGTLRQALERKEAFTTITDLVQSDPTTKDQGSYRQFIEDNRDALRRYCRGGALVVQSQTMRIMTNAFVLLAKIPFPTRAFNTQEEAVAWCTALLNSSKLAS